jgi:hypothetical protein
MILRELVLHADYFPMPNSDLFEYENSVGELVAVKLQPTIDHELIGKTWKLNALSYCYRNREAEYGSTESQLDEQFHNFDAWKARIQSIKNKYPKP